MRHTRHPTTPGFRPSYRVWRLHLLPRERGRGLVGALGGVGSREGTLGWIMVGSAVSARSLAGLDEASVSSAERLCPEPFPRARIGGGVANVVCGRRIPVAALLSAGRL